MSQKVNNIKDWILYVEDDKTKAFDVTGGKNYNEIKALCKEAGIPIVGYVAFEHEKDAIDYGNQVLR